MADNNANQNGNNTQNPQQTGEFTEGVVGLFHTISGTKTKVVYTNLFTGKIHVKSGGFFFNFPWRKKPVKISLDQHKIDTICRRATTLGTGGNNIGPMVDYDTDYFIKIVDPEKFMDVAYSRSAADIKRNIGDILDQKVQDYIRNQPYDSLVRQSSVDFLSEIGARINGAFPPGSLNQELLENYGLEVSRITFKVKPPQELIDEVAKTKQAEQAARTAEQERIRKEIEARGQAEATRITAEAEAEKERLKGAALASNIAGWIAAGMTNEQIATKLANQELVNGTNPHTIIMAAAAAQQQSQQAPGVMGNAYDMTLMLNLFNQIMQQNQSQQQQPQQQPQPEQNVQAGQQTGQQQSQQQPQQVSQVDWSSLPDDEYLTAEDSARLAAERGETLLPGGRYHISYLTDEQKTRYSVASQRGNTR